MSHDRPAPTARDTAGPLPVLRRRCACGGTPGPDGACAACKTKRLQRTASGAGPSAAPPIVHDVLRHAGRPLAPDVRAELGERLGHDFSRVRVHHNAQAAASAEAVSAAAYTVGNDVVFGAGRYEPATFEGRALLAHELVHVVQQSGVHAPRSAGPIAIGDPHDRSEHEAERCSRDGGRRSPLEAERDGPVLRRQGGGGSSPGCSVEVCWVPITAYSLGKAAQVHGVINVDAGAGPEHIEVDPSQHMPVGIWHSHVVQAAGRKSAASCQTLAAMCPDIPKLKAAATLYESKDVIYDPLTVTGPNSNSFVEWTLDEAGLKTSAVSVPFGATGWGYFQRNAAHRVDPPHVARVDPSRAAAPRSFGPSCTKTYAPTKDGARYVGLIRDAETKLTAAGITDVKERIKILRGLYYGTPWSRDFGKEQSLSRVAGFQTYTVSGVTYPRDPVSILDCGLYRALQLSQDVTVHGVTLDVGHLLIGLDAREATVGGIPTPSVPFPGFGGTGLEIVTWLGDLGGGAGSLARDRARGAATTSVATKFRGVDYGGSSNLEGDVASFIVASGSKAAVVAPVIPTGKGVADVLEAYLSPATPGGGTDWKSRATTFLAIYGGTFAAGSLTNAAKVIADLADKIEGFACAYITQRYLGTVSDAVFLAIADNVRPASQETAETFVHALEDAAKGGGKIEATRFPAAKSAAAGACAVQTTSIRAKQKAQQLWQLLEEQL